MTRSIDDRSGKLRVMVVVAVAVLLVLTVSLTIAVSLGWEGALMLLGFMVVGSVTDGDAG